MNKRDRKILSTAILFIGSVVVSFVIGEALVRIFGHYDIDGNFFLGSQQLKPYVLPVKNVSRKIKKYLVSNNSCTMYDSFLGWSSRPGSSSENGLYRANSDSIRTATPHTLISNVPKQGVLRIAIFGDSYTYGSDVPFENTWGYYLESNLRRQGVNAEVLNFGIAAYGMDQAFLRWLKIGQSFSPDIVIFGFCGGEIVKRNVNLIRPFLFPETGTPFSKPRFILKGEGLELINLPALPPEKVVSVMKNLVSWDLIKYEFWLNHNDYKRGLLSRSKFLSLILCFADRIKNKLVVNQKKQDFYSVDGELFQLTLKIIREFRNDVESKGAKFYIVFLPQQEDLKLLSESNSLPYSKLLTYVEKEAPVIHPEYKMLEEAKNAGLKHLFIGHYSSWGNKLVADVISDYLLQQKQNAKQEKP